MINAVERMQNFMNSNEKIVICTIDDRKIKIEKVDDVFAEDEFIMIKHEDTMKAVNSNNVSRMFIEQRKRTLLSSESVEKMKDMVKEESL